MKIKLIQPAMIQRPMDIKLKTRMAPSLALLTLENLALDTDIAIEEDLIEINTWKLIPREVEYEDAIEFKDLEVNIEND